MHVHNKCQTLPKHYLVPKLSWLQFTPMYTYVCSQSTFLYIYYHLDSTHQNFPQILQGHKWQGN